MTAGDRAPANPSEGGRPGSAYEAIAHEFKNLLLVISGLSELLLIRSELEPSMRRDVEEIRRATERAAQLSRRLFEFVGGEAARPVRVELNALLHHWLPMLGRLVGEEINLRLGLDERVGAVCVDPIQLEQALLNLVLNARDEMASGEIRVTSSRVEIGRDSSTSLPPGAYVSLGVQDDGPGMDEETQARLFVPYFTTKRARGGTGLGLSLVRAFALAAGGGIRVSSRVGTGTTIELLLPELGAEVPAPPRA